MIEINTKYFIDLFGNVYDDTIGQWSNEKFLELRENVFIIKKIKWG